VTVLNVAPTVTDLTDDLTVAIDEIFQFSVRAVDPGVEDILTYGWDLDNDGMCDDWSGPNGECSFPAVGLYTISVSVNDGDGGLALDSFDVTVVPEPSTLALVVLCGLALARRRR
jgi:hypothetical protein